MRKVISGYGADSTIATLAYLQNTSQPILRDLILIGEAENPNSIRLTTHDAPVYYPPWGTFLPMAGSRDMVKASVGLDVASLSITWAPSNQTATSNTATMSPFQLAAGHFYDNWPVRIFRCFMPTPGDAMTLGATDWYGGRIQNCEVSRNKLVFNTKSFLDVVTQKVPSTVIEVTNTLAATQAVTIPAGDASVPIFLCAEGSTENFIIADCLSPVADKIYSGNLFSGGYLVFLSVAGATLAGAWSAIGENGAYIDAHDVHHSQFEIYTPLNYPPTPGVDSFYVSMQAPVDLSSGAVNGFPYVPSPQSAV